MSPKIDLPETSEAATNVEEELTLAIHQTKI
jgi:hypothetical protein